MPRHSSFDATLLGRLPGVLAVPLLAFAETTRADFRLHRLCDAFEALARFATVLAVAEARLPDDPAPLPDSLVKEIGPQIEMPTFGRWLAMAGGLADFLAADRSNPMVLPELPRFLRDTLLKAAPAGNRFWEQNVVELRNTLAHGGAVTGEMAEYLLHGDAAGQPRWLTRDAAAGTDEEAGGASPRPGEITTFQGWEGVLGEAVRQLADLLQGGRLCSFDGEEAHDLTGATPSREAVQLPADLKLALRQRGLQGHVLLLRGGRWLDLWPLCDHGKARLMSLRGLIESEDEAPLLYFRGEPQRLLYAAFGTSPNVGESSEAVADFQALFRPERRQAAPAPLDFTEEIQRDSLQLVGRAADVKHVKNTLKGAASGVLWLGGTGGIGKSFLAARIAADLGNAPARWCCLPWRFRVSDADRSNPNTFLRWAITRLAAWPPLDRGDVRPDLDSNKLLGQLDDLLRAAGLLQPRGKEPKPPRVLFVLDGMDEAAHLSPDLLEWPFRFAYPNVVWLCAGRPGPATDRAFAADRCTHLFPGGLAPMNAGDVRELLYHQLGEQKYELLGLDRQDESGAVTNPLVQAIVEKSEGLPLYVRFLVEDLLRGHFELTKHLKGKLPQGLAAYYDDLLDRTGIGDVQALLPKLLGDIVWARGPLTAEVLGELLCRQETIAADKRPRLESNLQEGLRRAASLVRPAVLPEGGDGYEVYHTTFRDHFRANHEKLELTNDQSRQAFVRLTNDWSGLAPASARRYVFRHGPLHLLDGNLDRALRLADLADPSRAVVHHLLLCWELLDRNRTEEARAVLGRLAQRQVPRLKGKLNQVAAELLADIGQSLSVSVADLALQLLGTRRCPMKAGRPAEARLTIPRALQMAQAIDAPYPRAKALGEIAKGQARAKALGEIATAQARAGHAEEARLTFSQALRT